MPYHRILNKAKRCGAEISISDVMDGYQYPSLTKKNQDNLNNKLKPKLFNMKKIIPIITFCFALCNSLFAQKVVPTITRDGDARILDKSNYPFIAENADGIRLTYKDWAGYSDAQIATIFNNLTHKNALHHAVWHNQDVANSTVVTKMPEGSNVLAFMLYQEGDGMNVNDWNTIMAQNPPFPMLAHTRKFHTDSRSDDFRAQILVADGAEFEFQMDDPAKYQQAADLLEFCVSNNKICSFLTTYQRNHEYNLSAYKAFYYYLKRYFKEKNKPHFLKSDLVIFNVNCYNNDEVFPDADDAGGTFGVARWLIKQKTADDWIQPHLSFTAPQNDDYFQNHANITVNVAVDYTQDPIANIKLYNANNELIGIDYAAPYEWSGGLLDDLTTGIHQLKAVATDINGNTSDRIIQIRIMKDPISVPDRFKASDAHDYKLRNEPIIEEGLIRHVYKDEWVTYKIDVKKAGYYDVGVDLKVQRSKQYGGTIILNKGTFGALTEVGRFTTITNDPDQPALPDFTENPKVNMDSIWFDEGLQEITFTFDHPSGITRPQFYLFTYDFKLQGAPTIEINTPSLNSNGEYDIITAPGKIVVVSNITPVNGENIEYADLYINGNFVRRDSSAPYSWNDEDQDAAQLSNLPEGVYSMEIVTEDDQNNKAYKRFELKVVNRMPYTNLTIPGTTQAWHFDIGGEGAAYHDFNVGYERGLPEERNPRRAIAGKEDVEIDAVQGDFAVSGIRDGEWLSYTFESVDSGQYEVSFLAASRIGKSANIKLLLDGKDLGDVVITGTGANFSDYEWYTASGIIIPENMSNASLQMIFTPRDGTTSWLFFFKEFKFTKTGPASSPIVNEINLPEQLCENQSITVKVDAVDINGNIANVELLLDGISLGRADEMPYEFTFSLPEGGSYELTAIATDDESNTGEKTVLFSSTGCDVAEEKLDACNITASSSQAPNVPGNVADGKLGTRWSSSGDGETLTMDLCETFHIGSIRAAFLSGDRRKSYFDIQVSTDGISWTDVLTNVASSGSTTGLEDFALSNPVDARYVRYVGHGNSASSWNSVTELEVWGVVNQAPTVVMGNPLNNSTIELGESTVLEANAIDDGSITQIDYRLDKKLYAQTKSAPFDVTWTASEVGSFVIDAVAYDDQRISSVSEGVAVEVVDRTAPSVVCNNITVYLDEEGNALISAEELDGGSTDLSGVVSFSASQTNFTCGNIGANDVVLTVTDPYNNSASCRAIVTVLDTIAPVINLATESIAIWPPNHKYRTFNVADFVGSVSDNCADLNIDDVVILSVSSDEAENADEDGNTLNDIVIGPNCSTVDLMQERSGTGDGRVYTIVLALEDNYQNKVLEQVTVTVPVDEAIPVIDNEVVYSVNGNCTSRSEERTLFVNEDSATSSGGQHELVVYPNPTIKDFTIDFGEMGTVQVFIHNRVGGLVYNRAVSEQMLHLSKGDVFRSGVYVITAIDQSGEKYYQKLIIK